MYVPVYIHLSLLDFVISCYVSCYLCCILGEAHELHCQLVALPAHADALGRQVLTCPQERGALVVC